MKKRIKVGVLISGTGTNLRALIDASRAVDYPAEIVLVISNKSDAEGIKWATQANIPTKVIKHETFKTREEFDEQLSNELVAFNCELVCLAGFMRILSENFVNKWPNRIINIHPSLLPSFTGREVHTRVIAAGVRISGCTLHYVTPELDSGPIIAQAAVPVLIEDTPKDLAARVLQQEHKIYPLGLAIIASRLAERSGEKTRKYLEKVGEVLINF
ncbi:MAG: phosphoribosylglycinamide formyltransferase [Rhodospirillaceae bacterium]|nr:phosphoribosylglycinamide formyltransferase [Rhodospirillaceae bacterium]